MRSQIAALCYRIKDGKCQVLLITSRDTGRWIIPKGWPEHEQTAPHAAKLEAWEEAGAKGRMIEQCIGVYSYSKMLSRDQKIPCLVMVFPLEVEKLHSDYPEHTMRKRKWFSRKKAAKRVNEPELARILKDFDPRKLR